VDHSITENASVQRTLCCGGGKRLQRYIAEGLLILRQVLAEHIEERLGLLGAEVDSLKAADGDLVRRVLVGGTEGEKEVPDTGAHLHAVSVTFAVFGGFGEGNPGLGIRLIDVCHMLVCCALSEFRRSEEGSRCVPAIETTASARLRKPFQYR